MMSLCKDSQERGVYMERELPIDGVHRIIKKAGAERASDKAAAELAMVLEEIGLKIAKDALDYAKHAGRKTVKGEDIRIAVKKFLRL